MKTLYITKGNNMVVDSENNKCDRIKSCRQAIDYIYLVNEPMHVVYGYNGNDKEFDCEAGDIIISFYEESFKNNVVVVKSEQWKDNLIEYEKKEEEMKLRWAEAKSNGNISEDIPDACPSC